MSPPLLTSPTGVGVADGEGDRIFAPFYRSSRTRDIAGTDNNRIRPEGSASKRAWTTSSVSYGRYSCMT